MKKHRTWISGTSFLLALVGLALVPDPTLGGPADPAYTVTELAGLSYPVAINASGQVAGQSSVPCGSSGSLSCSRAFLYSSSTGLVTQLGVIGDGSDVYYSFAFGINTRGDVVGALPEDVPSASYPGRAVLYRADGGVDFLPPATPSLALAINDSGQMVGYAGPQPFGPTAAFLYDQGTASLTDIHAELTQQLPDATQSEATGINAGGDVVGWFERRVDSYTLRRSTFIRHSDGSIQVLALPSGLDTSVEATGVNDSGQVIGTTNLSSGDQPIKAILWTGSTPRDLGALPTDGRVWPGAMALGINRLGQVVGASNYEWYCPPPSCAVVTHAILYSHGVMYDLNDLIPPDSGWTLRTATAINDAGQIVVLGESASGVGGATRSGAVLLTPSPGTMIDDLIQMIQDFDLPKGTENSLVTKLENAQAALAAGDTGTACNLLGAFINETRAQSGKKLTVQEANDLIASAEQIRDAIGCS
jgi:probable HAF family extracellular repeat protein